MQIYILLNGMRRCVGSGPITYMHCQLGPFEFLQPRRMLRLLARKSLKIQHVRHASRTLEPPRDSPHFSLSQPLTSASLHAIRSVLAVKSPMTDSYSSSNGFPAASVLIGLCNIGDVSGIILEVRDSLLRAHSGEIRHDFFLSYFGRQGFFY